MIDIFSQYGNTREQASRSDRTTRTAATGAGSELPHGLSANQLGEMERRFASLDPQIVSSGSPRSAMGDMLDGLLPDGASWTRGAKAGTPHKANNLGQGQDYGNAYLTNERPYQPEFESPDRQQYPVHRILANRYWRLFYKLDPVIGTAVDMFAELPWSDFSLSGDGVDGEVRDTLETMCQETRLRSLLPYFVREFLVVGEACPHLFYDDDKGMWSHIAMMNPDQLDVIYAPFIKMDPIVEFVPDDRLREVLSSNNEMLRHVRDTMPPELVSKLVSRQHIPLAPTNFTLLARKLHPYDVRGTSIVSRMWRILMLEDAIFNATIQTARRHAGPIKVAKLGDPATGWIPGPEQEKRLLQLLAEAELDVNAWLVYHYGINFELVGTTERVMMIDRQWDVIERVKLVALGINKSFLHGEVTYASAASGLTIFLQRLRAMREYFENSWLYPKFFLPVAQMNGWIKPTQAELSGRVRVRRSHQELLEDHRYIMPKIEWDRSLDPSVDGEMISAAQSLEQLGVKFSKTTLFSMANRSYEDELRQRGADAAMEKTLAGEDPEVAQLLEEEKATGGMEGGPGGAPPMMGGGGLPGIPPDSMGLEPPGDIGFPPGGDDLGGGPPGPEEDLGLPAAAAGADESRKPTDKTSDEPDDKARARNLGSSIWDSDGKYGEWRQNEVAGLVDLFKDFEPRAVKQVDDSLWVELLVEPEAKDAIAAQDARGLWDATEEWLVRTGYPTAQILQLEDVLKAEGALKDEFRYFRGQLDELENQLAVNTEDPDFLIGAP